MKLTLIVFVFCVSIYSVLGQRKPKANANTTNTDKNCNKELFDKHSANVFAQFGYDNLPFPESRSQLTSYCKYENIKHNVN